MDTNKFIALMLVLIFIALAWRFLVAAGLLALSVLMWAALFMFCRGFIQGIREVTASHTEEV